MILSSCILIEISESHTGIQFPKNEPFVNDWGNLEVAAIVGIGLPRPKPDDLIYGSASARQ